MFVDCVEIFIFSGKGGRGAVSFRREKFVQNGGPDGGDGGGGGDVYFEVDENSDTLSAFRGKKHYRAQNGAPGESRNKTGARGEDLVIKVPPGTLISDKQSGAILCDMTQRGERVRVLKGGNGGFGNARFKTSVNQSPDFAKNGQEGKSAHVRLELKLIADVGLVGYPNVGKSTLISTLSNARPEIADYEFTTLIPKLGVVDLGDFQSLVMADIPGIIDGASEGRGLGLEFLRHIERTKFLLFVLDSVHRYDLLAQYENLKSELAHFSKPLSTRRFGVVVSKCDSLQNEEINKKMQEFLLALGLPKGAKQKGVKMDEDWIFYEEDERRDGSACFVLPIASVSGLNLRILRHLLGKNVKNQS